MIGLCLLGVGEEINTLEEERAGREVIAEYDKQKHEYRNAVKTVDLTKSVAAVEPEQSK